MRVAIIPARGGSQRIPGKNIRMFHGKPIIAYSIQAAVACNLFDHVAVSTDSEEIAKVAEQHGADVMIRPSRLADPITGTQEVMRHHLRTIECEQACCIYATAPLLTPTDLLRGWQQLHRPGAVFAFSVGVQPILHDAGQFYWGHGWAFRDGAPLWAEHSVMVPIQPSRDCDINTEEDWQRAERLYAAQRGDFGFIQEANKNDEWAARLSENHNHMLNQRGGM